MLSQDLEWNKIVRMMMKPFLGREFIHAIEELQKFQENADTIFQDMEKEESDE